MSGDFIQNEVRFKKLLVQIEALITIINTELEN
jgi:hypothetical protein